VKRKKSPFFKSRAATDLSKKEQMLAVFCRNRFAYELAKNHLTIDHVKNGIRAPYGYVWQAINTHYEKYGTLPTKGNLCADVSDMVRADGDEMGDDEKLNVDQFVDYCFDNDHHGANLGKSKKHRLIAIDTLKEFLEESALFGFNSAMLDGKVPVDVADSIDRLRVQLDTIGTLTAPDIGKPFPDGWDSRERPKVFTTGCAPLDAFMGGGWRAGEVVLFMGPFGSCKTLTTVAAVCGLIRYASRMYAAGKTGGKIPKVVLIFTEGSLNDYRERIMSHMARVPWKRLSQMDSVKSLSAASTPGATPETAYEKAHHGAVPGKEFKNERRRVRNAEAECNMHLVLLNCTDNDDSPYRIGRKGAPEFANIIRHNFSQHKDWYPLAVWLDHLSALVSRMMEGDESQDQDRKIQRLLKELPKNMKDHVGVRFGVPVGIMHQLSGEANARGAFSRFHHTDSSGCKSVAEFVDFAVQTGPPDRATAICKWDATKTRREPASPYRLVRIDGAFNAVDDVTDFFTVEGKEIIEKGSDSASSLNKRYGGIGKGMGPGEEGFEVGGKPAKPAKAAKKSAGTADADRQHRAVVNLVPRKKKG
jgi:hypothetical protein